MASPDEKADCRWDDLGRPRLDPEAVERLVEGLAEVAAEESVDDLAARRDELITAFVLAERAQSR